MATRGGSESHKSDLLAFVHLGLFIGLGLGYARLARKVNTGADDDWCGIDCPENLALGSCTKVFHKKVREHRNAWEDGGRAQRLNRDRDKEEGGRKTAMEVAQSASIRTV